MRSVQDAFALACEHRAGGRPVEAARLFREVLAREPRHHEALAHLGMIALGESKNADARELLARASTLAPSNADYILNLGVACKREGKIEEAAAAFTRAVSLVPDWAHAHYNLAAALEELGSPYFVPAYERAASLAPDDVAVQRGAAAALMRRNELARSLPLWQRTVLLAPRVEHLVELGTNLRLVGDFRAAVEVLRRATSSGVVHATALLELGAALIELEELDEAEDALKLSLGAAPRSVPALFNYATVLLLLGRAEESARALRRLLEVDPDNVGGHSNLLVVLNYHPDVTDEVIREEAEEWGRRHGARRGPELEKPRERAPGRLRLAYFAANFESLAPFMPPLFEHHDRGAWELFFYSGAPLPDALLDSATRHGDRYRDVSSFDDRALARLLQEDEVDVLVDLTMHLAGSRLTAFAAGKAPAQIAWLAYPGTTGVPAMRFRLTDPRLDPPGRPLPYTEESIWLSDTFWPYAPRATGDDPGALPALANGFVTFGSLNTFAKVNDRLLDLWGEILARVPGSRMKLLAPEGRARARVRERFARLSIEPERVEFVDRRPRDEYMSTYRSIDVCLDTSPYNGHTTTLDAFYMGVPVVTLVTDRIVGRGGSSIAYHLGLPELVAQDGARYVETAVRISSDVRALSTLRATLRRRMDRSPLVDGKRFVTSLETAYREALARAHR